MQINKQLSARARVFVPLLVQATSSLTMGLLHQHVLVLTSKTERLGTTGIVSVPCLSSTLQELVAQTTVLKGFGASF